MLAVTNPSRSVATGGMGRPDPSTFLPDQFCNSSKTLENISVRAGGGGGGLPKRNSGIAIFSGPCPQMAGHPNCSVHLTIRYQPSPHSLGLATPLFPCFIAVLKNVLYKYFIQSGYFFFWYNDAHNILHAVLYESSMFSYLLAVSG